MVPTRQARCSDEAGFTVIESTFALTIVFVVLLSLLAGLSSGAKGVVTGRQRSAGLAVANEILELARARAYAEAAMTSIPTPP